MTGIVFLVFMAATVVLVMRRKGRVFFDRDEGAILVVTLALCVIQKILRGNVSLSDVFLTPFYVASIISIAHARGSAAGSVCGFLSALVISFCAIAFTNLDTGLLPQGTIPFQHIFMMAVWMLLGALAGMREIPKALKPFLAIFWLLFVAAYNPQFLKNLSSYIILFGAISLSSMGLYLNIFKKGEASKAYYPTSGARRSTEG
ncbi:MAG: hypothetical protein ABIJ56_21185 [Pseudomonadota bacterium]